jgi:Flp pilus assembly pilin Flp
MFAELVKRLYREEDGQDLIEYGILTVIVIIVGVVIFTTINDKMADAYEAWGTDIQTNWQPNNPLPPAPPPAP